jgi:TolA-binding protein
MMRKPKSRHFLFIIAAGAFLGVLLLFPREGLGVSDQVSGQRITDEKAIRVEEGQGFTRVVFPCDQPEASSVKPDLEKARFVLTFPQGGAGMTAPPMVNHHGLVKKIDLHHPADEIVEVVVTLSSRHVDWVSYRYRNPSRTVLYLKRRSGESPSEGQAVETPEPKPAEALIDRGPEPTPVTAETTGQEPPLSVDPVEVVSPDREQTDAKDRTIRDDGLWRPSAVDIPEFLHVGSNYPPDFRELDARQRGQYREALGRFRDRGFYEARGIASEIGLEADRSPASEALAFFMADCGFRTAEQERGDAYMAALLGYQDALAKFPESKFAPEAVLRMATGYRRLKFFNEATVQYDLFLKRFPDNPAASQALFWKGECLFQRGKYEEAKPIFGEFAEAASQSIHGRIAALRVGDCLYQMGDLEGAQHEYGNVFSGPSAYSHLPVGSLFRAGKLLLEAGDFQKGREILFRAVNFDPESEEAKDMMTRIAGSYLEEDREDEALRMSLLLLEAFGQDDPRVEGLMSKLLKEPDVAVASLSKEFEEAARDRSIEHEVMYQQCLDLVERGEVDRARAQLEAILSEEPQKVIKKHCLSLLAYCLNTQLRDVHRQGDHLEVVRLYNENRGLFLGDENGDRESLLLVGESFQNLGLLEDALSLYRHLRGEGRIAGDHLLFRIGRLLALRGDREGALDALDEFQRVFPTSPYLVRVHELLGDLSLDVGDHDDAIKWYQLVLREHGGGPDTGGVYFRLAQALKARDREKEAMEAYRKATDRMWPFRGQAWAKRPLSESLTEMAAYSEEQQEMATAVDCYRKIVMLSPSDEHVGWALYRLGEIHRKMGDTEGMQQAFDELNQRSSDPLWAKLASWRTGDVAFESDAEPDLKTIKKAMARLDKE